MINKHSSLKSTIQAILYLLPFLIITILFTIWPTISAFKLSSYIKYNYFTNQVSEIGWDNFTYLFQDPLFQLAVKNTCWLVIGVVPISIVISLGIASLLSHITWLKTFFQTVYFLPFVTSTVAISVVWQWIFRQDDGLLNLILHSKIDWLNNPHYSLIALIIICVWQGLGINIILFLTGFNKIPASCYAAAKLDGANHWQLFVNITWPLLTPTTLLVLVSTLVSTFKVFDQVYALFNGTAGPANADLTLVVYLYQKFYEENQYPIAAACGVVLLIILSAVIGIVFMYFKRKLTWLRRQAK